MNRLDRIFHFVETRRPFDRALLKALAVVFIIGLIASVAHLSAVYTHAIPEQGGTLREGVVGAPRFINPVLAVTAADKDMVALIYAGLMRLGEDGTLEPNLAESVTVSDDGLTYNVILKENLTFHDGTPLTTDDVIFTIERIKDPALKSPLQQNFEGITIERIGDRELNFILAQPYAPFLEHLTVGILPKRTWEFATAEEFPFSQYNSEPIGSGPYEIAHIERNRSGIPETYTLKAFDEYASGAPKISELVVSFFVSEAALVGALEDGLVDSAAGLSPESLEYLMASAKFRDTHTLYETPLPRTFAVFLNQNEVPLFRDSAVRRALSAAVDRDRMVAEVLKGHGHAIDGPLPLGFGVDEEIVPASTTLSRAEAAREILRAGGWKMNEETLRWEKTDSDDNTMSLAFAITTANTPLFETMAHVLQESWGEIGIPVDVKRFEQSDLTQTVIRPRKYGALLFGTAVGRELDFYSFWHASQRNDPGLNIALYANITTDAILSELRAGATEDRAGAYRRFAAELKSDAPATFLFVPNFTYIAPSWLEHVSFKGLASPSERLAQIETWYADEESVWPFFIR